MQTIAMRHEGEQETAMRASLEGPRLVDLPPMAQCVTCHHVGVVIQPGGECRWCHAEPFATDLDGKATALRSKGVRKHDLYALRHHLEDIETLVDRLREIHDELDVEYRARRSATTTNGRA